MRILPAALVCLAITAFLPISSIKAQDAHWFLNVAKKHDDEGRYDSAVLMYERARQLFASGSLDEARTCSALGDIYKYVLYDFDKAEKNYVRALTIQQQADPSDTRALTRLYYNLATTNRSQHDYETALSWCMKAVDGCNKLKDARFLERTYSIAGNIYRDMHLFDSAVVYYQRAVGLVDPKDKATLAGLYGGWGETNYLQGDMGEASRKLTFAEDFYRKSKNIDKSLHFHTVRLLAEIGIQEKRFEEAASYLKKADDLRKQLNLEYGGPPSSFYKTYGDLSARQHDNLSAYVYYQKALQATTTEPLGRDGNPKDIQQVAFKIFAYEALIAKASVVSNADAIECYAVAEKIMMASRRELDTEDAKWSYVDAYYQLYSGILSKLYESKQRDSASIFYFMERSKSKSLADALQEAELRKGIGRGDTLLTKLKDLRQRSLSLNHKVTENNQNSDRDELIRTSQQISAIESSINEKYPSYMKTRYEGYVGDLAELKDKLNSLDAAVVEYFWGEEDVYALVITPATSGFYRLKQPVLTSYLKFFEKKVNQYSSDVVAEFASQSFALYSQLLGPFAATLKDHERLIIIPDGPLRQLPFETLVTNSAQGSYNKLPYLVNDFIISYNFSASHLLASKQSLKTNPALLAFGSTVNSGSELASLSGKFPGGTLLDGTEATEANFKQRSPLFDVLHLAVHGSGDTGEAYSATMYFGDKTGPEDGKMYWYELYSLNLKASLAVLSACESGIGKTYRGEGMLSMANAFTFAGANNIVMGLWKVDDQVSVKLMDTFYTELLNGMAIDEALALAKRTYLASADQISANPKLWGSLVAYGESPILTANEIPTSWVVLALTVLIGAGTLLVVKTKKKK